jgi:hypothetical protein
MNQGWDRGDLRREVVQMSQRWKWNLCRRQRDEWERGAEWQRGRERERWWVWSLICGRLGLGYLYVSDKFGLRMDLIGNRFSWQTTDVSGLPL